MIKLAQVSYRHEISSRLHETGIGMLECKTDFTLKRVVVSCLHDTVARFRTGVKFSPRRDNRSELTPGRLAPA